MISNPDFLTGRGQDQDQVPEFQELESPEGELHLKFYVTSGDEFALPAIGIREVISTSPDRITPIPNVSPLLLGTLNVRGRVIWVADLGQFLGDSAPLSTDRSEIHVIAVEDQDTMLGLAVDKIIGMDWLDIDEVQMPTNVPDSMAPFLRGEWMTEGDSNRLLRLLDQIAILRSARWAA
ncbi:MAG: chemotaxis protein CheW [Leptolyngbya sp. DLM2.Bin15]|jgi:twitching motility protein PilI|uniref:chemotaxis protein CheW n=1 Tax=Leptolyngbya sp. CCY15150 TaxID=2767772 RepID=UPI001380F3DA|nr:chemotaxis protein CheW [Leptolyngbya sp. CCY15150]MBF2089408.1 chemotaxis protein CheW [Synechococcales cyanobacterium K32_A2020_035]MBF2093924.1 chemotaxis protein CheW [Synechococcales cyanobacterium K44_A2020_017]TVQ19323.1 MAG: chemotaxis protein CheW [Leptolyngbya sp. DLM2.Bin15]